MLGRMPADRREREVRAVAESEQADLRHAERDAQILEIVGARLGVVGGQVDALARAVRSRRRSTRGAEHLRHALRADETGRSESAALPWHVSRGVENPVPRWLRRITSPAARRRVEQLAVLVDAIQADARSARAAIEIDDRRARMSPPCSSAAQTPARSCGPSGLARSSSTVSFSRSAGLCANPHGDRREQGKNDERES